MTMLKVGQLAPYFRLRTDLGAEVALSDLKGKRALLFFYPKADTPG
jgi:peroxiredoxin Q/BCP